MGREQLIDCCHIVIFLDNLYRAVLAILPYYGRVAIVFLYDELECYAVSSPVRGVEGHCPFVALLLIHCYGELAVPFAELCPLAGQIQSLATAHLWRTDLYDHRLAAYGLCLALAVAPLYALCEG